MLKPMQKKRNIVIKSLGTVVVLACLSAVSPARAALVYEWDADVPEGLTAGAAANTWEDTQRDAGFNLGTGGAAPTYVSVSGTTFSISNAYRMDGGDTILQSGGNNTNYFNSNTYNPPGNITGGDTSFEVWVKPDWSTPQQAVLFESGGSGDGMSILLSTDRNKDATAGDARLIYTIKNGSGRRTTAIDFDASDLPTDDFTQVMGTYNKNASGNNDYLNLYVNGQRIARNWDGTGLNDWTGGNLAGIGMNGEGSIGGDTANPGPFENFGYDKLAGDVAKVSIYDHTLQLTETRNSYDLMMGAVGGAKVVMDAATDFDATALNSGSGITDGTVLVATADKWDDAIEARDGTLQPGTVRVGAADGEPGDVSPLKGINFAYRSDANGEGTTQGDYDGLGSGGNASFEIWFKPSSLTGGQQCLWESGGTGTGSSIALNDSTLSWNVDGGSLVQTASHDISSVAGEFIQAVGTVNLDSNTVNLYVNGLLVDTDNTGTGTFDDWCGTDDGGIGIMQGTMGALGGTWNSFIGDIALFKLYNNELTAGEVARNYYAITLIPEPSAFLIWALLAGLGMGLGWRRRQRTK